MPRSGALLAVSFVSGLLGGVGKSLFLWACHHWGVFTFIQVRLTPHFDLPHLYPAMLSGGLWGLLYFLFIGIPRHRRYWIRKGLWVSIIPTAVAIFYLYPSVYHHSIGGINLGWLMPVVILVGNLWWGFLTGFFTRLLWGR